MITLILIFLKIGFLGFGGGYAMLSLIFNDSMKLGLSIQQFADLNTLDLIAPGPIAVNSATYVGYITFGIAGAIGATLAVCTSSFVLSTLFLNYEDAILNNKYLKQCLTYTKFISVSMILSVAATLTISAFSESESVAITTMSRCVTSLLRFKLKLGTITSLFIVAILSALMYFVLI